MREVWDIGNIERFIKQMNQLLSMPESNLAFSKICDTATSWRETYNKEKNADVRKKKILETFSQMILLKMKILLEGN